MDAESFNSRRISSGTIASTICLFVFVSIGSGHAADPKKAKPDGTIPRVEEFTADLVEQGKHNLNVACSRCHGRDGRGGKGPDLTNGLYRHARTDKDIIDIISNGISGTSMPGFGAGYVDFYLPIMAYIRVEGAKSEGKETKATGDIAIGKLLFKKHNCGGCHWTDADRGRFGTNLTKLAATVEYVRESMRYPNTQVDGTHQRVNLLDKDGRILTGKRLSEDGFHILVMDRNEDVYSVDKRDLERLTYAHESLMPDMKDVLTIKDIEDLTTYVLSLQKAPTK